MKRFLPITVVCAVLTAAGCGDSDISRHPLYTRAMQERAAGRYQEAEQTLKKLLAKRPDTAHLHMALASLYDEHLGDPLGALYHYREAERIGDAGVDTATLQAWIQAARDRFAATLPDLRNQAEFDALQRMNTELQQMVTQLRRQIAAADTAPAPETPAPATAPAPTPAPATARVSEPAPAPPPPPAPVPKRPRIHRIASGDTLGGLARRYYGSASQFRRIMEANHLTERTILKIGQEIIIPDRNQEDQP